MKKIINILAAALLMFPLQSCLREEKAVFDKSASERIQLAVDDVKKQLTSSQNGWLLQYWTGRDYSLAGYNVLVRFEGDYAYVSAEFAASDKVSRSSWDVKKDQGPVLTFDTYNELMHQMSNPSSSAIDGQEGDFEFVVQKMENDVISLKGKKFGNYMKLTRVASDVNWEEYLDDVKATANVLASSYLSAVDSVQVEVAAKAHRVYVGDDGIGVSFIPTASSLILSSPVEIEGKTIEYFDVNVETGDLSNPEIGSLIMQIPPVSEQLATGNWFIYREDISAKLMNSYFSYAEKYAMSEEGETILYALLCKGNYVRSSYTDAWGFTFLMDAGYAGQLTFNTRIVADDQLATTFSFDAQGDGSYYFTYCRFHNICMAFGYGQERIFTLTCDNPKSPTWIKMVDNQDPLRYLTVYAAERTYYGD